MTERHLVLAGFGNVGRRFVQLLHERVERLERDYGVRTRVVGIATRRHGAVFAPDGIDALRAAEDVAAGRPLAPSALASPGGVICKDVFDLIARAGAAAPDGRGVLIETTTLDVVDGEPAASHLRSALGAGLHAITANKGPIACAYRALAGEAERAGRTLRFEGAVMDGVPIFNLARETLRGAEVLGVRGVVNSTTNYILSEMERGTTFAAALADMQAQGIAEADATLDVEGWDAAAKVSALANVLMGAGITPRDVDRTGITSLGPADLRGAIEGGMRLRLIAAARRVNGRVVASVKPRRVPERDLLGHLDGLATAVVFETDLLDEIAVVQCGGGLVQTAYALLSDLLSLPAVDPARP